MTTLTVFRDHCRRMAAKTAPPDLDWALWTRLADEIDAYLAGDLQVATVFDDMPLEGL
jgi:hypothetical protein